MLPENDLYIAKKEDRCNDKFIFLMTLISLLAFLIQYIPYSSINMVGSSNESFPSFNKSQLTVTIASALAFVPIFLGVVICVEPFVDVN